MIIKNREIRTESRFLLRRFFLRAAEGFLVCTDAVLWMLLTCVCETLPVGLADLACFFFAEEALWETVPGLAELVLSPFLLRPFGCSFFISNPLSDSSTFCEFPYYMHCSEALRSIPGPFRYKD